MAGRKQPDVVDQEQILVWRGAVDGAGITQVFSVRPATVKTGMGVTAPVHCLSLFFLPSLFFWLLSTICCVELNVLYATMRLIRFLVSANTVVTCIRVQAFLKTKDAFLDVIMDIEICLKQYIVFDSLTKVG